MSELDRTAVVVGGAGAIGGASAKALARDGFFVVVADVLDGAKVVAEIRGSGGKAAAVHLDLLDASSFAAFLASLAAHPPLRALVITAALLGPLVPLREYRREDWDRVVGVNLTGTFFLAQLAANHMAENGGGRVVLFNSGAGRRPTKTVIIPYIATKAAIPPLISSLALSFKGTGVLFAAVDPGRVLTDINRGNYPNPADAVTPDLPAGRLLEPEEVAEVVAFLCSSRANGVTGANWGVSTIL